MADTIRKLSDLQALLANNTTNAISPQDHRDCLVSSMGVRYVHSITATPATLGWDDDIILADATSGAITIPLPAVASFNHKVYTVKKTDSSGNNVTLDGNSSETIDGATTKALTAQYKTVTICCDGTKWHIIAEI